MPARKPKTKKGAGGDAQRQGNVARICGPAYIQTLQGKILDRDVALICCGEAHEDALDLTRKKCITEPKLGWIVRKDLDGASLDIKEATATQGGLTLAGAQDWAKRLIERDQYVDEDDSDEEEEEEGGLLLFKPDGTTNKAGKAKGTAWFFQGEAEIAERESTEPALEVYEWGDLDLEAHFYNKRRFAGEDIPSSEYDELIAKRKQARKQEGIELFDDWLIRHAQERAGGVNLVLEAAVRPDEVELHVEHGIPPAPQAHETIRLVELDSDSDSDDDDPDDGTGTFLDYLRRRVEAALPKASIHCVDPRELGDADVDTDAANAFQNLLSEPLPADAEDVELTRLGAELAEPSEDSENDSTDMPDKKKQKKEYPTSIPSWEAYFGAAAELLYYSANVKADYTPFLAKCVGSMDKLQQFFEELYFGAIPDAVKTIRLDETSRAFAKLRSLAYQKSPCSPWLRRPHDHGLIPVKSAPVDCYLKAKGSNPPQTWVARRFSQLKENGGETLAGAAKAWYRESVTELLSDPKNTDTEGDYFVAWLRECHRDIYDDIDTSDPLKLREAAAMKSDSQTGKKHKLKDIRIPGFADAFNEINTFDATKQQASTLRQRVLAKMIVDAFQLRLVDLSMILATADVAAAAETGSRVVIVLYAGADHVKTVEKFWRNQGFSAKGLSANGLIGKDDWDEEESRVLEVPDYLTAIFQDGTA